MTTRIGIDFGTANTVVARWDEARSTGEPIPLDGIDLNREAQPGVLQRVVPSLLAYSHADERRWLGAQVLTQPDLLTRPDVSVFQSTKSAVTGRVVDIPRSVGERRISARDAATQFLRDVTALTVLAVGADDLEIVATAPVEAFDTYRDWLVGEVGDGLGGTRLRVVDEATAAAVGYSARMRPGEVFCVVDFGAATLDIAVVRVVDPDATRVGPAVRTISAAGLDLGGNHIDALLAERAAAEARLPLGDPVAANRVFRQLLRGAEAAKIALTRHGRASIVASDPVTGREFRTELDRAGFDRLLREADVLGRVNRALRRSLDGAAARGHPADSIGAVFLVGGSTLLPAVQDLIRLQFAPEIVHSDRPLEAVAAGAASIAGGFELHDHIQHDYAIRHVSRQSGGYEFEPLVASGTAYPTPGPVKTLTVKAIRDGQRQFGLAIYERAHATFRDASADLEIVFDAGGGARTVAVTAQSKQERAMVWLNEDKLTFLEADPPAAAGTDRFRLEFQVDAQKRLTVSAFDLHRGILVLDHQPVVRLA
ncbi:MAG TPA: Hsp70 family protein [Mycobacteriales bacterium]|nr:Hsp70 family protein [Mycobacteriales bacterium]